MLNFVELYRINVSESESDKQNIMLSVTDPRTVGR